MRCPYCKSNKTKVIDKRDSDEGISRRRRECLRCFKRFTTYERVENVEINVEKRDGTVEQYDRSKLNKSIMKSVRKGSVEDEQVHRIIDDIESKLLSRKSKTVKSSDIGEMVLTRLKWLDGPAYMRFASIYRGFESLEDFEKEIKSLKKLNSK
ncbi:transcriptional repressor NrdR [Candidatus Dojkabacteria bacterium]|nr:transcriptional repressor NrdR [Candidatus Dojkabacteria bacterium]